MGERILCLSITGCLLLIGLLLQPLSAADADTPTWLNSPPPASTTASNRAADVRANGGLIEATIIYPFRTADVGTEVGGIIEGVNFDEGDKIKKGAVVVVISRERFVLEARKAEERVSGLRDQVTFVREDLDAKEDLFKQDSASKLDVLRARMELSAIRSRLAQAEIDLESAGRDLKMCQVKAPFAGYMSARYKQPHEPVRPLDKLFSLVDSERVFAVAYVPEELLPQYSKGRKAVFVHRSGKQFIGTVERIGKVLDPKTKAKKVYLLLDNPQNRLEIGMIGSMKLSE